MNNDLTLDHSLLVVSNLLNDSITFCHQVVQCYECDLECSTHASSANASFILDSNFEHRIVARVADSDHCVLEKKFLDREECVLTVNDSGCSLTRTKEGWSESVAIWTMVGAYVMLTAFAYIAVQRWNSYKRSNGRSTIERVREQDKEESDGSGSRSVSAEVADQEQRKVSKRRVKSLDAFRGAVVLLMIFVNYGGGHCSLFEHTAWYGLTVADIVFPAFVMVMGFSIALSTRSRLTARKDFLLLLCKVFRRSAKLLILGIILNSDYSRLHELRIPGVLQRFAVSYFVTAMFHVLSVYRANRYLSQPEEITRTQLLIIFAPEIAAHMSILLIYLYFTFWFTYSSQCPPGYQGPGGLEYHSHFHNCTGGAANYLDRLFFGPTHIYQRPTSQSVFKTTVPHDPEGLLGSTTSILAAEFGLICGRILIKVRSHNRRLVCWFFLAAGSGLSAFALSYSGLIPVVKNLWSLSFVCATVSLSLSLFMVFYVLIDTTGVWGKGSPLHCPGSNPMLLYVGHMVLGRYFPFYFAVGDSHIQLLAQVSFSCFIWLLISMELFRRKIFWTL